MSDFDILSPIIQTPLIIIGVLLLAFGILEQSSSFVEWGAQWSSILRRTKIAVTNNYINSQKTIGLICIIGGIILIIASFTIPQLVNF